MIRINGVPVDSGILYQYGENSIEGNSLKILLKSETVYNYDSQNELRFELKLRKSIVVAATDLNRSYMDFLVFRKSKCNKDFWVRTDEGGFELRGGVKPSDAIKDIYINSRKYGTECATAMVIVYYKALVDVFPEDLFNRMFSGIYLMNWKDIDDNFGLVDHMRVPDYLPGDCRYFKNPDVDPLKPEWQGENVFLMNNGLYYGHGIGITTGDTIIEELNRKRRKGSTVSAYLLPSAKRLNFKYLSGKFYSSSQRGVENYSCDIPEEGVSIN